MPYPASLIAYAFVKKGIEEGNLVTQMKLQKMVYFAHGYHLARYNEPLVQEIFEAWKYGPVIPGIYQSYKLFGNYPINDVSLIRDHPSDADLVMLPANAKEAIDYTWEVTKDLSATNLSAWTHKEGSPWDAAYSPYHISAPIENDTISKYFNQLLFN